MAQEYKVKKRRAVKIVELDPIQEGAIAAPQKEEQDQYRRKYGGPLGILEPFQYETESYEWTSIKSRKPRTCIYCGKPGTNVAYFQIRKAQIVECYCSSCLDKWVYLPK